MGWHCDAIQYGCTAVICSDPGGCGIVLVVSYNATTGHVRLCKLTLACLCQRQRVLVHGVLARLLSCVHRSVYVRIYVCIYVRRARSRVCVHVHA